MTGMSPEEKRLIARAFSGGPPDAEERRQLKVREQGKLDGRNGTPSSALTHLRHYRLGYYQGFITRQAGGNSDLMLDLSLACVASRYPAHPRDLLPFTLRGDRIYL